MITAGCYEFVAYSLQALHTVGSMQPGSGVLYLTP